MVQMYAKNKLILLVSLARSSWASLWCGGSTSTTTWSLARTGQCQGLCRLWLTVTLAVNPLVRLTRRRLCDLRGWWWWSLKPREVRNNP